MNWLDKIILNKRGEVSRWKVEVPISKLSRYQSVRPDFTRALRSRPVGLIAEVKRKSPSAGPIREPFNPVEVAQAYERGGAQALSVLMDREFFGGGPEDFAAVRSAVSLPLLYKEFVVDEWQVHHAASLGASAVLLIVAALSRDELSLLMKAILDAGMKPLVEVHDEEEARAAVDVGAEIIGINNRNLKTFVTTLETTERVIKIIPDDRLVISESGIRTAADVSRLRAMGVHAILVGEHLLRKSDLESAVRDLMG
ncbi:MAG TPA: indole-3-glycerol phosphate synthase TrpC [Kiritimatiellia bacterium]|nr:indole-3-glycerol phosphate synthase TrpC [Kiritimatiellia bacterium]